MNPKSLLTVADDVISQRFGRHLTDVETAILTGSIADQTYEQIAESSGYSISYVKRDVGPKLWRSLSEALGEDISKTNFRAALGRYFAQPSQKEPIGERPGIRATQIPSSAVPGPIAASPNRPNRPIAEDSEIYVERSPIETICYETLQQPGSLVRIKASNLMGKTSLINRMLSQLEQTGYRAVNLSLDLADKSVHFNDINRFMRWFCAIISRELRIANKVDEYWDEEFLGAKMSCTAYFEEYLLAQVDAPVVLGLDDVDLLFSFPVIYEDFFSLLRAWHEKAKSRPIWKQMRLLLAHTTDVYIQMDINQSPFNVGVPIELSDFTAEQVRTLAQRFGVADRIAPIAPLINMVGGHPYLLEQTFTYLKNHPHLSLEQVLATAPTEAGIYAHHLRKYWLMLQKHPELMQAFRAIANSSTPLPIDPNTTYQLQRMGLVKFVGNDVAARCNLYQQYFSGRL